MTAMQLSNELTYNLTDVSTAWQQHHVTLCMTQEHRKKQKGMSSGTQHRSGIRIFQYQTPLDIGVQRVKLNMSLKTPYQLENYVDTLVEAIQQAVWENTSVNKIKANDKVTYPFEVRKIVNEKRKARKNGSALEHPRTKLP